MLNKNNNGDNEKKWNTLIAASVASTCSVLIGSPFDSLKVRLQTSQSKADMKNNNSASWNMMTNVYRREGFRGFFRGILPPLLSVNVVKTLSISVYEHFANSSNFNITNIIQNNNSDYDGDNKYGRWFLSGCLAGVSTSVISSPMEMIRNQRILNDHRISAIAEVSTKSSLTSSLIIDGRPLRATTWSYFKRVYEIGGVRRGLYRGYSLHLIRESLGTGIYWLVYESVHHFVHLFNNRNLKSPIVSTSGSSDINTNGTQQTKNVNTHRREGGMVVHFVAGSMTGIAAWLVVFPVDLIKNQYQKQLFPSSRSLLAAINNSHNNNSIMTGTIRYLSSETIWDCIRETYRNAGMRGFYRGMGPCIMRAVPIHGVTLLVYEFCLSKLR